MKPALRPFLFFTAWLCVTGVAAYMVHANRSDIKAEATRISGVKESLYGGLSDTRSSFLQTLDGGGRAFSSVYKSAEASIAQGAQKVRSFIGGVAEEADGAIGRAFSSLSALGERTVESAFSVLDVEEPLPEKRAYNLREGFSYAAYSMNAPSPPLTLTEIKRRNEEDRIAQISAGLEPSSGTLAPAASTWPSEAEPLSIEAVLVPRQVAVISSSQDGRIAGVFFTHGEKFRKGDLLVAYDCDDLKAETDIIRMEKNLTSRKVEGSNRLFKLDIISEIDRMGAQVEDQQAAAKTRLYEARLKSCEIRAEFNGHVTNRLANPGEYTRTDRVLMEVASDEPLQAEFLLPSKWLRWVNVNAPVTLKLAETERTYTARISRIHGEVDPVSQSIQMVATLDPYDDPLLPGMSGQAVVDAARIRQAGIRGFLEKP